MTLYPGLDLGEDFKVKKRRRRIIKQKVRAAKVVKVDSDEDCYYDSQLTPAYHTKLPKDTKSLKLYLK